jgi:hypothetical protein
MGHPLYFFGKRFWAERMGIAGTGRPVSPPYPSIGSVIPYSSLFRALRSPFVFFVTAGTNPRTKENLFPFALFSFRRIGQGLFRPGSGSHAPDRGYSVNLNGKENFQKFVIIETEFGNNRCYNETEGVMVR